jgi:hypothetical protein
MPMVAVAAVGTAVSAYGAYKQSQDAKKAREQAAAMMSPAALKRRIKGMNPQLYDAVYGEDIFAQDKQDIAQAQSFGDYLDQQSQLAGKVSQNRMKALYQMPGYQDPTAFNYGLTQAQRNVDTNMGAAGSMVGRLSLEGGMADSYAFANQMMKTQIAQQSYEMFRQQGEQLARADMTQGQNMLSQAQAAAQGQAGAAMPYTASAGQGPNWANVAGQGISAGIGAYSAATQLQGAPGTGKNSAAEGGMPGTSMPSGYWPQQKPASQWENQAGTNSFAPPTTKGWFNQGGYR